MNMKHLGLTALAALTLTTTAASAQDYLSVNAGYYDALRDNQKAGQFGAEYRFNEWQYGIRPIVGGFATTEGGLYGYGGLNWDVALLPNQLYLIPNFAIGAYSHGGGKDLGGVIEFRSGIELAYQFENAQQVGVALNHLSNAGIYSHNPGEETIMATYSIPLTTISGWMR